MWALRSGHKLTRQEDMSHGSKEVAEARRGGDAITDL